MVDTVPSDQLYCNLTVTDILVARKKTSSQLFQTNQITAVSGSGTELDPLSFTQPFYDMLGSSATTDFVSPNNWLIHFGIGDPTGGQPTVVMLSLSPLASVQVLVYHEGGDIGTLSTAVFDATRSTQYPGTSTGVDTTSGAPLTGIITYTFDTLLPAMSPMTLQFLGATASGPRTRVVVLGVTK
jgi:hypothetical protein